MLFIVLFCFGSYVDVLLSKAAEKKSLPNRQMCWTKFSYWHTNTMSSPQKTKNLVSHRNDVNEIEIVERGKKTWSSESIVKELRNWMYCAKYSLLKIATLKLVQFSSRDHFDGSIELAQLNSERLSLFFFVNKFVRISSISCYTPY